MAAEVDGGSVVGRLELNIKGWEKAVDKVQKDQQSLSGLVMRHDKQIKDLGKTLTVTGTAMVASLSAIVMKTANAGEEALNLSKRFGISTESISANRLALDKSGASVEGYAAGMKGLSNTMQAANSGNKTAAALFDTLGVKVTKADGSLRNMDDVMLDVADRFAGMKDGAAKAALAQDLFGKSGAELIPFLNMGRKGLEENAEAARKLGIVWSRDAAEAAAAFNDSLAELKGGAQGLGIQLGQALMPVLQGAVNSLKGLVGMVRDAAAAHPFLIQGVGSLGLAFGAVGMTLGPLLVALPGLVRGFTYLKAMLATTALGVTALAATFTASLAVVILYISKLAELGAAEDRLQSSTKTLYETENNLIDKLSAAASAADWQYGRMSKLIEAYNFNYIALIKDIQAGKLGIDIQKAFAEVCKKHAAEVKKLQEATGGLTGVQQSLNEKLGLTLRVDLEKKYRDMLTALTAYKGKLTDDAEKKLTEDLIALRAELDGTKPSVDSLDETLQRFFENVASGVSDADVEQIGGEWSAMITQMQRDTEESMRGIVEELQQFGPSADLFDLKLKTIGDALGYSAETVRLFLYELMRMQLAVAGIQLPDLWGMFVAKGEQAIEKTRSVAQEVSTVVSDAIRNIASAVVGVFDFKGLFGAQAITVEFDSSPFDAMVAAATSAYDKVKAEIESSVDALKAATDKEIDLVKAKYDAMEERARKAFSAEELLRSRAEQDSDIRRSRQEDREDRQTERNIKIREKNFDAQNAAERKAIEDSEMTWGQKAKALQALEREQARERIAREKADEKARLALEIAREDAKLARDRKREDDRLARQEKQELKLEAIRAAGAAKEQALRDASAAKEQAFLTNLLNLQNQHQLDLDAIRTKEDLARQKQADDEEKRQGSLWFKVKGIFATACENMATIFLTKMFEPVGDLIGKLAGKLIGKGTDSVADALDGTGEKVKGLGTTIGEFISGIGSGIGGFISGLATGIASAIVALATGVASAATIIAAAAPAIIVTSLLAMGIVAGLNLLKRIFSSGGGGAGDGMGRVVERLDIEISLLTMIRDLTRNDLGAQLGDIKTTTWSLNDKFQAANNWLQKISTGITDLVKKIQPAASGWEGTVSRPTLFLAGERDTERVSITPTYPGGGVQMVPGGQGGVMNVNIYIDALDGADVKRVVRDEIAPELQYLARRRMFTMPAGAIGGS